MTRSKMISSLVVVLLIFGMTMIDSAMAGERVKAHATSVNTKFHQIEVGDEEGHVIAIVENKQIWVNEKTGEKSTGVSFGFMDMNPKKKIVKFHGYSVRTYPNGEKWFSKYEGKPVGKGHMKGTFTYNGGTGKFEGLKGGGTWESKSMAQGVSYMEAEGVREYGGK